MPKKLADLSAQELYHLAAQKEQEEQEAQREANAAEVKRLQQERKAMLKRHRDELAELEAQIAALQGQKPRKSGRRRSHSSRTDAIMSALASSGPMATAAIREALKGQGIPTDNIAQTLAGLKKQGRIESAGRAMYRAV